MKLKDFKLGPTGRFPRGKADASDHGEISVALATDVPNGIVRLMFGTQVEWIGLPPREARELAQALIEKAAEVERRLP